MENQLRILHLEDNQDDAKLIQSIIESEGIECRIHRVEKREEFISALERGDFDLIISDFSLPSFDGLTALTLAQQNCPDIPFIFISGALGEDAAIEGLKLGASDYVLKNRLSKVAPAVRRAVNEADERTRRKEAEEQMREQAALLDIDPDAIIVRDMDDRILFWSKGAEHLYGWTKEEAIGKKIQDLHFRATSGQYQDASHMLLQKGKWIGEWTHITKEGKYVQVDSHWTLVHDQKGKPKSVYMVNTNVTEKKKIEAQFLRAQRMESVGTLAGGIAHDLNNILAPILMASQILKRNTLDEQSQRMLYILETNAQRGTNLIRQVLSFARGVEGERTVLQVRHLVSELEKVLKETFVRSIEIKSNIPKEFWPIMGDPTQIHQILLNLCVNARDAMPNGGILTITGENIIVDEHYSRLYVNAKPGPYSVITVADTGSGIPPELKERIFEPFFTTKELGKGTGLGLSTVYSIVKSYGGFIDLYSEVGKGTRFKIYLPAVPSKESKIAEERVASLPTGNGELILVVDDESSVREITKLTLETFDYTVITASDGAEAVALYSDRKDKIKVVILDMNMPVMDGPAAIQAMRKCNPDVKIIGASGLETGQSLEYLSGESTSVFLQKPFTAESLLKVLNDLLTVPAES